MNTICFMVFTIMVVWFGFQSNMPWVGPFHDGKHHPHHYSMTDNEVIVLTSLQDG